MSSSNDVRKAGAASTSLPALSRTYQADQLMTPRYLQRITIDQPHYHGHLSTSYSASSAPLQRRTMKMGDKHFHLLKDIPVEQNYARTGLKLSEVRPWDQLVARPLCTSEVISKELHLPFPQEHPYTSHISRFSVFPDTKPHPPPPPTSPRQPPPPSSAAKTERDASTQTPPPPTLKSAAGGTATSIVYTVPRKASEMGVRVERRQLTTSAPVPSGRRTMQGDLQSLPQIWDLPRSRQFQRSMTYPAPKQQYGPPPSTTLTPSPLTPASHRALEAIHERLTRTTAYSEHFPLHTSTSSKMLHTPSAAGRLYCRPWTAESRGKYYSKGVPVPGSGYPNIPDFDSGTTMSDITEKEELMHESTEDGVKTGANEFEEITIAQNDNKEMRYKVESSTQTEDEDFTTLPSSHPHTFTPSQPHHPHTTASDLPSISQEQNALKKDGKSKSERAVNSAVIYNTTYANTYTLPQLTTANKPPTGNPAPPLNSAPNRPHSASEVGTFLKKDVPPLPRQRPHTTQFTTPPSTSQRTRHMMQLFNGFSRTGILAQFHRDFPEGAPDLREGGGGRGQERRHRFQGYHAYDFH